MKIQKNLNNNKEETKMSNMQRRLREETEVEKSAYELAYGDEYTRERSIWSDAYIDVGWSQYDRAPRYSDE